MSRQIPADGLPTPQRYVAMVAIGIGIVMSVLDASVANVALPTIATDVHAAPADAIWVVNAYQLAIVASLLPLAALGERIEYRRVYAGGLLLFTIASFGCALAHSLPQLVAARIVQGFGAAGIMAVNGALVRFTYPQALLGRGVGLNALTVSIAAALGPTVAAGILAVAPWEWLFAVNVPLGIVNLLLAARALPSSPASSAPLDRVSVALNAATFGGLFVGVDLATRVPELRGFGFALIVLGFASAATLVRRELHEATPLFPLDLLRLPIFALSVVASICSFAAQMLAFVALPFFFETVLHHDQVVTGLLMTPWPVALGVVAPFAGRLSDRVPAAILGAGGLSLLVAGLLLLARLPAHAGPVDIAWRMALAGIGFGFFQAPNNRTMLGSAPRSRAGAAGGMLATARLLGLSIGATLAAVIFHLAPQRSEPLCLGIGAAFGLCAAIASVARLSTVKPVG